jgi:hypothetical protein
MLSEPIVRPIRDGRSPWRRREASPGENPRLAADRIGVGAVREPPVRVADCSFWVTILLSFCKMGSLPPIRLPIRELRSVRGVERLFIPRTPDELVFRGFELTAGCLACREAEEFRVPIVPPIRERRLVLDWLVTFETDDRPLESFLLESLLERAAGWSALLGADGLVVLIVLPMREVMPELIRPFVAVDDLFVTVFRELLFDPLVLPLIKLELLLDGVRAFLEEFRELIMPPMREVRLELILLFELLAERFGFPFTALRLLMLLRLDWLDVGELRRIVICRPSVLEFGAVERELTDRLVTTLFDMLLRLLDERLVTTLLDMLLLVLGERLVTTLFDMLLLLGARLVTTLLFDMLLLLGVRFVTVRLEMLPDDRFVMALLELILLVLRLDEMLLDLLEEFDLDIDLDGLDLETDLDEAAGLEAVRWLEPRELLERLERLERLLAAKTGSQNNKRAKNMLKNRKNDLFLRDFVTLILNACSLDFARDKLLFFAVNIIRPLSSAFTSL